MPTCCQYYKQGTTVTLRYRECSSDFCPSPQIDYTFETSWQVPDCSACLRGFMPDEEIEALLNQKSFNPDIPIRTKPFILNVSEDHLPLNQNLHTHKPCDCK